MRCLLARRRLRVFRGRVGIDNTNRVVEPEAAVTLLTVGEARIGMKMKKDIIMVTDDFGRGWSAGGSSWIKERASCSHAFLNAFLNLFPMNNRRERAGTLDQGLESVCKCKKTVIERL